MTASMNYMPSSDEISCISVKHDNLFTDSNASGIDLTSDNDENKLELLRYIEDVKQRLKNKTELYSRNHSAAKLRPDSSLLAKLDSSLKKNSAFVRKLRNFTSNQLDGLLKDLASLNLTKYLSEVAASLVDVKLKVTDVQAVITLCSELHATYNEFSSVLHEYWTKTLINVKKGEPVTNPSKLRVDLRVYADLVVCGVFSQREALPTLITTLTNLMTGDKDTHRNINIIISFCRHCGDDFAGLVPQRIRFLSECYNIEVPRNNLLSTEKQETIRNLLKEYYVSLCRHLLKVHTNVKSFESQNKKILLMKGEVQEERVRKTEELQTELQALLSSTQSLSQLLDEQFPDLPEPDNLKDSADMTETIGNLWEDEESRKFYQEFPNLQDYLPILPVNKQQKPPHLQMTEEKLDEELKEEDFLVEDPQKDDITAVEEQDDSTNVYKAQLDVFINHLPQCVNREMIDNAAIEFLISFNTKIASRKLIKALFNVHRTRLDLLPFYGRLIAILNPAIPELSINLVQMLKQDFKYHVNKKDQVNVESKIKVIRFIGELVKFELYPKLEALYCLKLLLHDFTHHHIEMTCNLLETCGRFLYRSPDTHHRTKIYLEQMMRLKTTTLFDNRYSNLVENTFYFVNPPDSNSAVRKQRPPMQQFIKKTIFQDLMQPGYENNVLKILRCINWDNKEIANYTIKCLVSAWKVKYHRIPALANLIAGVVEYQEFVGSRVVDGVIEDIRIGMELNAVSLNQRRVAVIKYYGELYNYRLIDSNDVFKVLYSLITFGVSMDPESPSSLDPPDNLFRIRLVLVLLDTCASFFTNSDSKMKLTYFFTYFQNYFWYKKSLPIWDNKTPFPVMVEHQFLDALHNFCPCLQTCLSYEQSLEAINDLTDKLMDDFTMKRLGVVRGSNNTSAFCMALQPVSEESETSDENCDEHENKPFESGCKLRGSINSDQSVPRKTIIEPMLGEDDTDFLNALDQMVSDNVQDRIKESVRPPAMDISVPLVARNKKYPVDKNGNFLLILRKGNKQQCKSLSVPEDSDLVLSVKSREEAERKEMKEVKQLTLDINERLQEEEIQELNEETVNVNHQNRLKSQMSKYFNY
ncbi:regulator of nonsense transcripts 2-like isoform X2 [Lycorma delicatula]|uniref:regulator of nonsense transcripts 2-like isoform X2 n=1 Tax=Lycorma delicatula TaxID=130591 RepID=UPI003F50FAB7